MATYKIVSDQSTVDEFTKHYFKMHPRARKKPIDTPLHPSMNKWIKLPALTQDGLKQKWKKYAIWLVEKHGFTDLNIEKCYAVFTFYRPTKRRFDCDNISPKFFLDGVVEAGMLIDDDRNHMNPLIIYGEYDKNNPRMEVEFITLEEGMDLCFRQ